MADTLMHLALRCGRMEGAACTLADLLRTAPTAADRVRLAITLRTVERRVELLAGRIAAAERAADLAYRLRQLVDACQSAAPETRTAAAVATRFIGVPQS